MITLSNVKTGRGQTKPPSVRVTPDTLPEAKSSQTGVSVRYVPNENKRWHFFRASYSREGMVSDYINEGRTFVYIDKRYTRKTVNDKSKKVLESLIPKEKGRLTETIGTSISENLMNKEVLEKNGTFCVIYDGYDEDYELFVSLFWPKLKERDDLSTN